jgi:hypothetical protein
MVFALVIKNCWYIQCQFRQYENKVIHGDFRQYENKVIHGDFRQYENKVIHEFLMTRAKTMQKQYLDMLFLNIFQYKLLRKLTWY